MLAFTLSKLNLLILVTALFSIIAFFMFHVNGVMIKQSAEEIAAARAQEALGVLTTDSLCAEAKIRVEREIPSISGRYFYAMEISKAEHADAPSEIFFKIVDRKERGNVIAAKSFSADATFRLFRWVDMQTILEDNVSTTIDPQSAPPPIDAVYIIKEVYQGKTNLYIIPCSASAGICELNKAKVGSKIKEERGTASKCIAPEG